MNSNVDEKKINDEESPPFFSSWNKLYGFVFLTFIVTVSLFYLFTKAFE
jgi:hypothetical protein